MTAEVVTVLGAGAMGSALTSPAADAGATVRLWGTHLDDELLDAVDAGEPHPRTRVALDPRVRPHRSDALDAALDGATIVVLAVSSAGVADVLRAAAPSLHPGQLLAVTTKGFGRDRAGRVVLLPDAVDAVLGDAAPALVVIGGPCKANEVAARQPTAAVHAGDDPAVARRCRDAFATEHYAIEVSDDPRGVEIAAAMKNVYAIALGICQGLSEDRTATGGEPFHDLQAATFSRAVREMAVLARATGGRTDTVTGLAGVGDLEVTALSGRNRLYGTRLGHGEAPGAARQAMHEAGQTVEGAAAAELAAAFVDGLVDDGSLPGWSDLTLLGALLDVLGGAGDADLASVLRRACLPR